MNRAGRIGWAIFSEVVIAAIVAAHTIFLPAAVYLVVTIFITTPVEAADPDNGILAKACTAEIADHRPPHPQEIRNTGLPKDPILDLG